MTKTFSPFPTRKMGRENREKEDKDVFDYPCTPYLQDAREFWPEEWIIQWYHLDLCVFASERDTWLCTSCYTV